MDIKLSERAKTIAPSLTRKLFNMALQYDDVINLTLGDPDLLPPQKIRDAACAAIQQGKTRYSANAGLLDARKAAIDIFTKEYGLPATADNVMLTVGGMEGLYLAFSCLVNPSDEVIIPGPYYVNYYQMVQLCGGNPVIIDSEEEDGFAIQFDKLETAINDKTVAIVINSPCNPTGQVLSEDFLHKFSDIAKRHNLFVISDEVYKTLIYDGAKHHSILEFDGMQERTLLIDSMSKRFSMTGYRCGIAFGPQELIANMTKMQENVAACTPLPSQYALIEGYTGNTDTSYILDAFQKRRDVIYNGISAIPGLSCRKPQATFYQFVNISETGLGALDFAYKLLKQQHVAVVPGISYGEHYNNFIRIAFTLDEKVLQESVRRIAEFVKSLKK